jgi:hypothetical protein
MIFMDSLPIKSNSACNEEQLRAYLADTRIPLRLGPMTRRRMRVARQVISSAAR